MYDTIIIGGGMAGLTAAMYAKRRAMKTLLITKDLGGQLSWAGEIENYSGFDLITGSELSKQLEKQAQRAGYEIKLEEVTKITRLPDGNFSVIANKATYKTRTIIFALGLVPRFLNVPGEKELSGKGVSYCANCDGPFFKDKKVAVVGGGNSALDAAEVLSKIASEVYLIHRQSTFKGFENLIEAVKKRANIHIILDSEVINIGGTNKVQNITIKNKLNQTESKLEIDGIFVEIGHQAQSDLVANLVARDEHNQIIIDAECRTNVPGFFAVGDITTIVHKQLNVAAGHGTIAALNAYKYLQEKQ
jgi:thioredoxin-disulfide reductase